MVEATSVKIKRRLTNGVYFFIIFLFAFSIAAQALVRRVNGYEASQVPLLFSIKKENIILSNAVAGRIENIAVTTGEHVHQGDLLVTIVDDSRNQRIAALRRLAKDNISAETELATLNAQSNEYKIHAPRDGVIYHISAAGGSYLTANSPLLTMFADSNVEITSMMNQKQYAKVQGNKEMEVYSPRLKQIYKIIFVGVGRVKPATNNEESKFEMQFRFKNNEEGAAFIEGEQLEAVAKYNSDNAMKPSVVLANMIGTIVGKNN